MEYALVALILQENKFSRIEIVDQSGLPTICWLASMQVMEFASLLEPRVKKGVVKY